MFLISFIPPGQRLWGESQQIGLQPLQHQRRLMEVCVRLAVIDPRCLFQLRVKKKNAVSLECILLFSAFWAAEFASLCSYWVPVKLRCYCSHLDKQINLEGINTLVRINCSNHSQFTALHRKVSLFWSYQAMNEEMPADGNRLTNFSVDFLSFLRPGDFVQRLLAIYISRSRVYLLSLVTSCISFEFSCSWIKREFNEIAEYRWEAWKCKRYSNSQETATNYANQHSAAFTVKKINKKRLSQLLKATS